MGTCGRGAYGKGHLEVTYSAVTSVHVDLQCGDVRTR